MQMKVHMGVGTLHVVNMRMLARFVMDMRMLADLVIEQRMFAVFVVEVRMLAVVMAGHTLVARVPRLVLGVSPVPPPWFTMHSMLVTQV